MMNINNFASILNKVIANVNRLEKKMNEMDTKTKNGVSGFEKDRELPVHNGKKVNEDMQDSIDALVQRVDYLENKVRKNATIMGEEMGQIKAQQQQRESQNQNSKSSNANVANSALNNQMSQMNENIKDMQQQIQKMKINMEKNHKEVNNELDKLVSCQKKNDDIITKYDLLSLKQKNELSHIEDKVTQVELQYEHVNREMQSIKQTKNEKIDVVLKNEKQEDKQEDRQEDKQEDKYRNKNENKKDNGNNKETNEIKETKETKEKKETKNEIKEKINKKQESDFDFLLKDVDDIKNNSALQDVQNMINGVSSLDPFKEEEEKAENKDDEKEGEKECDKGCEKEGEKEDEKEGEDGKQDKKKILMRRRRAQNSTN